MSETTTTDFKSKFLRLVELREKRDETKAAAERANKEYREYEAELYQELQDAGIRGRLTFDFGPEIGTVKFQRRSTTYGRVIDKATAIQALKAIGKDEVILQEAIAEGRLNEYVRHCHETQTELADGVDYYTRDGISISRS